MKITKNSTKPNERFATTNEVLKLEIDSIAETQVLMNALQAYGSEYFANNYGEENYKQQHQDLIERMYAHLLDKYLEFTPEYFYIGQKLQSKMNDSIWEVVTIDKEIIVSGRKSKINMIMQTIDGTERCSYMSAHLAKAITDGKWVEVAQQ